MAEVHDTRCTCASLLAALDVHSRVYTQIPSPETRKALDRLNQSLNP
ncbi:hypothetical protein ACIBG8_44335 [Nonomuraea sp. NPDC050556]